MEDLAEVIRQLLPSLPEMLGMACFVTGRSIAPLGDLLLFWDPLSGDVFPL